MSEWETAFTAFVGHMHNRLAVSEHKYGSMKEQYPLNRDALISLEQRLQMYRETHNLEWLVDAANFVFIELFCSRYPDAHFRPTDSDESPGIAPAPRAIDQTQWHGRASKSAVARARSER